ncbi:MAG: RimK family protein [Gammaproteobacteria bacterium]|nr:RimK family protein [Gammaproteobacteria bacterium]
MSVLIVVDNPQRWPLEIPGVGVVSGREYLTDPRHSEDRTAKVFNLCRSYRYQTVGYYVSLLAEARGHKPLPNVSTIQDLKSQTVVRTLSEEVDDVIQRALRRLHSNTFTLSIYFGQNLAKRYERLALWMFNLFPMPMLRAKFVRVGDHWDLQSVRPIAASDIPESHRRFAIDAATTYFTRHKRRVRRRAAPRYDIAVLHNPGDPQPPSDARALKRFEKAAEAVGLDLELITRDDFARLGEFDALFIRETTAVNHHTYRFAQRAAAEGLVVIDDPDSILKCTNKVYLAELMDRYAIPTPKTLIVHRGNVEAIKHELGFPCVLKQPDSAFSLGVTRVETEAELEGAVNQLFAKSDLVIAQEFMPTDFDWRVGIIDQRPLYVCRYHMARRHWQIIRRDQHGRTSGTGNVDTLTVGEAPEDVVRIALKAANLIGDGLYGVDIKQIGRRCVLMEVNDNPNLDAGVEDTILKDALYREIMGVFLKRIEIHKRGHTSR